MSRCFATVATLLLATALAPEASAQQTTPDGTSRLDSTDATLVGSWFCTGRSGAEGLNFLTSFNLGGTYTVDASIDNVFSGTHGNWKRTGLTRFQSTDVTFLYDENGQTEGIQTAQAMYRLLSRTDLRIDLFINVTAPDGAFISSTPIVVTCERIPIGPFAPITPDSQRPFGTN